MKTRIPNFNTLSTLLDRLSIENVKLAHFENELYHEKNPKDSLNIEKKIEIQNKIITDLKIETVNFMNEAFVEGGYEYTKEERTFN